MLGATNLQPVHVRDERSADLLTQAIDANDDGTFDELIFQADIKPREARRFTLTIGERRIPKKEEFRAYGRFVRERRDDFAWENDLVAHRMYGAALETLHVDRDAGVLRTWEPLQQEGFLGCAVIAAAGTTRDAPTADGNYLLVARMPAQGPAICYAGSTWDKAGELTTPEAWGTYLAREAARLRTPVVVRVAATP